MTTTMFQTLQRDADDPKPVNTLRIDEDGDVWLNFQGRSYGELTQVIMNRAQFAEFAYKVQEVESKLAADAPKLAQVTEAVNA